MLSQHGDRRRAQRAQQAQASVTTNMESGTTSSAVSQAQATADKARADLALSQADHDRAVELVLLVLNILLCSLGALASLYAIARIALLAELDVRFHPIDGLLAALRTR